MRVARSPNIQRKIPEKLLPVETGIVRVRLF
jgi:hypothetical protein